MGWCRCNALITELSALRALPDPYFNCRIGVPHVGRDVDVCADPQAGVKSGVPSAGVSW